MDDISVRIGKNLLALRKKNGLTQADVSAHLNKSFFAYSNYETGKRTISIDDLIILSRLYNVSIDEIVGNEITYNRKKAISFKTYGQKNNTTPVVINTEKDEILLFKNSDFEINYYIKTNDIILNEHVLIQVEEYTFPAYVSRSENPSGYLITNLITKESKFCNNTSFKTSVVILGRYAGKIDKEINIPDFF